jgi:hypothetical protein
MNGSQKRGSEEEEMEEEVGKEGGGALRLRSRQGTWSTPPCYPPCFSSMDIAMHYLATN